MQDSENFAVDYYFSEKIRKQIEREMKMFSFRQFDDYRAAES
jgi:hypothetical protein